MHTQEVTCVNSLLYISQIKKRIVFWKTHYFSLGFRLSTTYEWVVLFKATVFANEQGESYSRNHENGLLLISHVILFWQNMRLLWVMINKKELDKCCFSNSTKIKCWNAELLSLKTLLPLLNILLLTIFKSLGFICISRTMHSSVLKSTFIANC
jgi:hypothetical protein